MSDLKEFSMNMPMIGVSSMGGTEPAHPDAAMSAYDVTAAVELPAEISNSTDHIYVAVESASNANYDPDCQDVMIDLVLTVNIANPTHGASSNYKMVKRLKFDKLKLAYEAESLTPVSVTESEDDPVEVAQMMGDFYAAKRARELVGLSESKGDKTFTVVFKYSTDKDPGEGYDAITAAKARADGPVQKVEEVNIPNVKNAAEARHVFSTTHNSKKYPNLKIVRATEVK